MKITIEICENETLADALRRLQMGLNSETTSKAVTKKRKTRVVSKALGARLREKVLALLEKHPGSTTSQLKNRLPSGLRAKAGHRRSPVLHDLVHRTRVVKASGSRGKRVYRLA